MKIFSLLCAAFVVFACSLCAQGIPNAEIPAPPPRGVSDSGGVLGTVSNALEATEKAGTTDEFLDTLVIGISTGLHGYFERRDASADGSESLKLSLATIGFLSLLALCGLGLGWLMGRSDKRQAGRRVFPPVDVPERLSAPYGGGGGGYGSFGNGS